MKLVQDGLDSKLIIASVTSFVMEKGKEMVNFVATFGGNRRG
jgi:hypothetical protein